MGGCCSSSVVVVMIMGVILLLTSASGDGEQAGELGRVMMSRDEGEEQQDMMSMTVGEDLSTLHCQHLERDW